MDVHESRRTRGCTVTTLAPNNSIVCFTSGCSEIVVGSTEGPAEEGPVAVRGGGADVGGGAAAAGALGCCASGAGSDRGDVTGGSAAFVVAGGAPAVRLFLVRELPR